MFANSSSRWEHTPAKQKVDSSVVDMPNSTGAPLIPCTGTHLIHQELWVQWFKLPGTHTQMFMFLSLFALSVLLQTLTDEMEKTVLCLFLLLGYMTPSTRNSD